MELNATAKVVLGMICARPRSGYEIKQLVDNSTRFFWAASYGQIYPELRRLEKAGLIEGADASQGARQRTVFEATREGRRVAREWIDSPPATFELRDEGLLELFFAGVIRPGRAAEIARERAAHSQGIALRLAELQQQIDADAGNGPKPPHNPDAGSLTVLRFGKEMNEWIADWFDRAAADLERNN